MRENESGAIGVDSKTYGYDELQRLVAGGTIAAPEDYSYDPVGNRDVTHLSALHVANDADRLLEDEQFAYSYDANGNLTSKTAKVGGAVTAYAWNAQDQLIRIDRADGTIVTYSYDALGRRIRKGINGTLTRYVYDGEDIYLETDELR
jgi:YD repeat-containing protein